MKKTAKTKQKVKLIGLRQWVAVALLVMLLIALGFVVYGADQAWMNR